MEKVYYEYFIKFSHENIKFCYDVSAFCFPYSLRTAQRHARALGYSRNNSYASLESVIKATQSELEGVSRSFGANMIWQRIRTRHGLNVNR